MSDSNDCVQLVTALIKALQPEQHCCPTSPNDRIAQDAMARFNETASQVAGDKLTAMYERQQDRWHVTMRQNTKNAGFSDASGT